MAAAISRAAPGRPTGMPGRSISPGSSSRAPVMGVAISPGATALTVTPSSASSTAITFAKRPRPPQPAHLGRGSLGSLLVAAPRDPEVEAALGQRHRRRLANSRVRAGNDRDAHGPAHTRQPPRPNALLDRGRLPARKHIREPVAHAV